MEEQKFILEFNERERDNLAKIFHVAVQQRGLSDQTAEICLSLLSRIKLKPEEKKEDKICPDINGQMKKENPIFPSPN